MTTTPNRPYVIAIEEHFADPAVAEAAAAAGLTSGSGSTGRMGGLAERLADLGELRLREMDEAGIDFQVISHAPSAIQQLNAETAVQVAAGANNLLRSAIDRHPDRFGGFASLPAPDPAAAADELERCVRELGFKGGILHGATQGVFHDDPRFWPIFERAQALDVPVYIHPGPPHPAVVEAYWGDYLPEFPGLSSAAWGYTIDTANQVVRLILSGVFERYPELKLIVGHLGEGLPFLLDRIDEALKRPGGKPIEFKRTFCEHFYVTTSGFFSTPALLCTLLQVGADRILFSVDYPFVENAPGTRWMETVPLSETDRQKLLNSNARRLLKLQAS